MYRKFFKRIFDIILSLIGLIVLSPIMLITYVLVIIFLGFPGIFKQERPGKNEKIFKLYKFRTMTDARDKKGKLLPDEKRLTRFGKFLRSTSIDELPELVNILKGDMSFIGPRPLLIEYLPYYTDKEHHRHDVRPGLTGLAQVSGRNSLSWDDRFRIDLQYIDNMSLLLDLRIVFLTVKKVLKREDIQVGNELMMEDLDVERKNSEDCVSKIDYSFYKAHKKELSNLMNELASDQSDSARIMNNMGAYLKDGSARVLCYRKNGVVVGIIWDFKISKKRFHINYFVVDKKCRGEGIGQLLIKRTIEQLKNDESLELLVDKDNKGAIRLYKRNGFLQECYNEKKYKMVLEKNKKDRS